MAVVCESVGTIKRIALIKDQPCSADGCDQQALLRSGGGPACNRHYQLWLKHRAFQNPTPRVAKTRFDCTHCGIEFTRTYDQTHARQARAQYCSSECFGAQQRQKAEARREARFWSKIDRRGADECWPYMGYRTLLGYGHFQWGAGVVKPAHRAAYELHHGVEAGDKFVCHSCDNPPCCNPRHLWLGTAAENNADRDAKGRTRSSTRRGEAANHAKLTAEQALEVFFSSEPAAALASRFGISKTAVRYIQIGRNWAHVTGGSSHA
jgi:hypothetical protein